MLRLVTLPLSIAALVVAGLAISLGARDRADRPERHTLSGTFAIPASIQAEHEAIHSALVAATQVPGRVGDAARALATVLHPHFVREEQIALPPLALLAPLAAGTALAAADASSALDMTEALRRELPRMLEEHKRIRAAVGDLRAAALAEKSTKHQQLAEQLALHAQTEEEVLYPAAVLVGELIRLRKP